MTENEIGTIIVDTAIIAHRELGHGLLELVYRVVLEHELKQCGINVEHEVSIPIVYKGIQFDEGFRADLIVEGKVILELKSIEHVSIAHKKQAQTYLRLTGCKLGYLLNFGEENSWVLTVLCLITGYIIGTVLEPIIQTFFKTAIK